MATLRLMSSIAIIRHNLLRNGLPDTLHDFIEKVEEEVQEADTITESGQLEAPNLAALKKAADLAVAGLLTTLNRICLVEDISIVQPESLARLCSTSTDDLCLYSVNLKLEQLEELVKESQKERWKIQHLNISDMIANVEGSKVLGKLTANTPIVRFSEVSMVWEQFEEAFTTCLSEEWGRCKTVVFSDDIFEVGVGPGIVEQYREKIEILRKNIGWRWIVDLEDCIAIRK